MTDDIEENGENIAQEESPVSMNATLRNLTKLLFSSVAGALIILHLRYPKLDIDTITLSLFVLLALPWSLDWILPHLKSAKFGELELQFTELRTTVKHQHDEIQEQQKKINDMMMYSMSASIYKHLWEIHIGNKTSGKKIYYDNDAFRREMYFLRDNGYVRGKGDYLLDFNQNMNENNLCDVVQLTPIGHFCVELRRSPK
jgi:hypothetical protein